MREEELVEYGLRRAKRRIKEKISLVREATRSDLRNGERKMSL